MSKAGPRERCMVGCAMARSQFEVGNEAEGLYAYDGACKAQSETHTPLDFLETFIACEWVLRTYIWKAGSPEVDDDLA